jgi:hypothetical protein
MSKLKPWNAPAGARERAKSRGKAAAAKLGAEVKKRRATAAVKHKAGRSGPR